MIPSRGGPAQHAFARARSWACNSPASLQTPHGQRTHRDRYTALKDDQAPPAHGELTCPETMSDIIIRHRLTGAGTPALDHLDLLAPPVAAAHGAGRAGGWPTASSAHLVVRSTQNAPADTEVMTRVRRWT